MHHFRSLRSPFFASGIVLATLTAVGATTLHRLAVTQTTGSEGAQAFVNTSPTGSALQGNAGSAANTSLKIPFGIFGEYAPPTGTQFGIGVVGISTTGYGVAAETLGSNPTMLALQAGSGDAFDLSAGTAAGTYGMNLIGGDIGIAVTTAGTVGISSTTSATGSSAIFGETTGTSGGFAVDGSDDTSDGGVGVVGFSQNGMAASFTSDGGTSPAVQITAIGSSNAISAYSDTTTDASVAAVAGFNTHSGSGSGFLGLQSGAGVEGLGNSSTQGAVAGYAPPKDLLFQGVQQVSAGSSYSAVDTFEVQGVTQNRSGKLSGETAAGDMQVLGDVYLSGSIYTGCSAYPAVSATTCTSGAATDVRDSSGRAVDAYTSSNARRTIEDEGETTLVNGVAHVALDPTFASTISTRTPYLVFLNAWGDTRGLYSLHRSPTGFDVRENGGGRSTLSFDYRIVAKPFDDRNERMALRAPRDTTAFIHRAPMPVAVTKPRVLKPLHVPAVRKTHYADLLSR